MKYVKGDLLKLAPTGSAILHSCNCQGIWGAGIALSLRRHSEVAFRDYERICKSNRPEYLLGKVCISRSTDYTIISAFVSNRYGSGKDPKELILHHTAMAFKDLAGMLDPKELHMPKINSGLFGVPWESTEVLIHEFLERKGIEVTVYEL